MTLEKAKQELEKFVQLKTTLRPAFVDVLLNAEEVKHGHWIITPYTDYDDTYECSVCGVSWTFIEGTPKDNEAYYCPHCGAKKNEVMEDATD